MERDSLWLPEPRSCALPLQHIVQAERGRHQPAWSNLAKIGRVRKRKAWSLHQTTMLIVDSKSIRNADTAKKKAMMRENLRNKAAYRSWHHGLPHAIYMTTANITDRSGAINMVEYLKNLPQVPKNPVDGGYTEQNFSNAIRGILRAEVEVVKRN